MFNVHSPLDIIIISLNIHRSVEKSQVTKGAIHGHI